MKYLIALLLALSISACSTVETKNPLEPQPQAWHQKKDLLPELDRDPAVEEYLKSVPDMDERYLILDRCFTKAEIAATQQIARLQEPNYNRDVHRSSMLWVLQEQLQFPEEIIELYLETFEFVWDTFSMTEQAGYVQWVTHNECIKEARANGELAPLTTEQQKELDEIESRYHHLKVDLDRSHAPVDWRWLKTGGTSNIDGDGLILKTTVTDSRVQNYCTEFSTDVLKIVPLKRVGLTEDRIWAAIDTTGLDEEYLAHWIQVIKWTLANDYDFALDYKLHATLACLNHFDKDEPI